MAFGKRNREERESAPIHQYTNVDFEDLDASEDEELVHEENISTSQSSKSRKNNIEESMNVDSTKKPLLDEIIILGGGQGKNPGGSKYWLCKYCQNKFTSSYTRIHHHFFGAPGKKAGIQRCSILMNDREKYELIRKKVQLAEKIGVSSSLKNSTLFKVNKPSVAGTIEDSFKMMERHEVDVKIIKGLCANGIPFNVLRNPQFHEMVNAINRAPKGYKAPSYEKGRTTLLDECKRNIEKELIPVHDTWYSQGLSIVSDGWSNIKHNPLINVVAVNSRGASFLYAEDFSGIEKTGKVIAEFLLKAIDEVGDTNVLQVVTDNAANCKLAGKLIEKVHKHIFWSPCVVHTLNLIFKDFAKEFEWLRNTYKIGKNIVKYFLNHNNSLHIFRTNSKLELLKVAKTRFASHYILLKRLFDCREALATTVVQNSWKDGLKNRDEHARTMGALIADTVTGDDFWDDVENIIIITKPIYLLIKFCDGDGPKMGEVYEKMDNMVGEISDIMKGNSFAEDYNKMEEIILSRWEKMTIPLHCLGFALTPRFYDLMYLRSPAPGGIRRKAPNEDKEVVKGVMEAFEKISESEEESKLLREQFASFHLRKGLYAMAAAQTDAVTMDAIDWWGTYGSETPELAEVAKKVLSQPITSSSAERNWSTYSYIHSVKRNRLNSARADKLVYIHSNLRLLSRFTENYKVGAYKKWDIEPEESYVDDSSVRLENLRWKSLDNEYVEHSDNLDTENEETTTTYFAPSFTTSARDSRKATQTSRGFHQTQISSFTTKGKGKRIE